MYRQLDPDRIVETADRLQRRIQERFHDSDLSHVAVELLSVTRGAHARAEQIERPILSLRVGLGLIVATVIVATAATGFWIARQRATSNWADLTQGLDAGLNVLMLLGAACSFWSRSNVSSSAARHWARCTSCASSPMWSSCTN